MKLRSVLLSILLASCVAPQPTPTGGVASELAGRVAGATQQCVPIERDSSLRVAEGDRHILLYGYGKKIWANHLGPDCGFNRGDALVVRPIGSSYCRGDLVRSFDPVSRFPGTSCILNNFVPYTRAG